MTTLTETLTDLSDLRRQRIEARQALAHWRSRSLRIANSHPSNCYFGFPKDPYVEERLLWWQQEYDRLTSEIEAVAPSATAPIKQALSRAFRAAGTPLSYAVAGFTAVCLLAALPAVLVAAGVVFVAWVPWLVLSKLSNR